MPAGRLAVAARAGPAGGGVGGTATSLFSARLPPTLSCGTVATPKWTRIRGSYINALGWMTNALQTIAGPLQPRDAGTLPALPCFSYTLSSPTHPAMRSDTFICALLLIVTAGEAAALVCAARSARP